MLIINFEGREAKGLSKGRYDETFAGEDVSHGAMGLSAVCDCGISLSYSLTISGVVIDSEPHQSRTCKTKTLICSTGCPCSCQLFHFSILHSHKNVNTITYQIQTCFVS